ncbi:MAG: Ig-like domain-containing protein [Planctomycetaceae bacterium]
MPIALRQPRPKNRRKPALTIPSVIELLENRLVLSATANNVLLFSLAGGVGTATLPAAGTVGGSDIISWNGSSFGIYFQGSDVGLGSADIDAFALVSDTEILMSFSSSVTVAGIGTVDGSDIVLFSATSLGANSAGTFSLFFDGSQFGLGPAAAANNDAIEYLDNGHLLISTIGDVTLPSGSGNLTAADEDLLEFSPSAIGPVTAGTWSLYFDGSDVQLTLATEDVDAVAVGADGNLLLSTSGSFFVPSFGGDNEDVLEFVPTSLGGVTSGTFLQSLFFDGSAIDAGLINLDVDGIDMLIVEPPPTPINTAPIAFGQSLAMNEDASASIQLTGDDGDADRDQPLTFVIVSGPAHGTLSGFDSATGRVIYTPAANFSGTDSFTFYVTDSPGAGETPLTSEITAITLSITATNDPPSVTVPTSEQVGDSGETIVLNGISISDGDGTEGTFEVRLAVASGRITIATGLAGVQSISGNGTGAVTIRGTQAGINAAFGRGVQYLGATGFFGIDAMTVLVNDLGNGGAGGNLSATASINLRINEVIEGDALTDLQNEVKSLVSSGSLSAKLGNSLLKRLDLKGDRTDAIKLGAFILETQLYRFLGILTREQARSLTSQADAILDEVKVCGGWFARWRPRGWFVPRFGIRPVDIVFVNFHSLTRGR